MLHSPTPTPTSFFFTTYFTASSAYEATFTHLQTSEVATNLALSQILKLQSFDTPTGPTAILLGELSPSPPPPIPENVWIACWTDESESGSRSLDFLLSATHGPIGPHPIFIVAPNASALSLAILAPRMARISAEVENFVPEAATRVFSVFGPTTLTQAFVRAWCNRTGALPTETPYLSTSLVQCTRTTVSLAPGVIAGHRIRLARAADADDVAEMCRDFSTEPYLLDLESARQEAVSLIACRAMWVYEVPTTQGRTEIASILAVGRKTANVACVTKVYTSPTFSRQGYAGRLLQFVCEHLLNAGGISSVIAFIPHGTPATEGVFRRIGFLDSDTGSRDWLEVGFQDTDLGHW